MHFHILYMHIDNLYYIFHENLLSFNFCMYDELDPSTYFFFWSPAGKIWTKVFYYWKWSGHVSFGIEVKICVFFANCNPKISKNEKFSTFYKRLFLTNILYFRRFYLWSFSISSLFDLVSGLDRLARWRFAQKFAFWRKI